MLLQRVEYGLLRITRQRLVEPQFKPNTFVMSTSVTAQRSRQASKQPSGGILFPIISAVKHEGLTPEGIQRVEREARITTATLAD
jgi:hypothetical protein